MFFNDPEERDDGTTINNRVYNNTISNSAVGIAAFRTMNNTAASNQLYNITMSHYRLNASSSMIIANQTFDGTMIEGQSGENIVTITNSSRIQVDDEKVYDTSIQHSIRLSNLRITVGSVSPENNLELIA